MRSSDERISAVRGRASQLERERAKLRRGMVATFGSAASLAIILVAASLIASVRSMQGEALNGRTALDSLMGSVFTDGSALGYVVMGLLGAVLGVTVTLLGLRAGYRREGHAYEEASAEECEASGPIASSAPDRVSDEEPAS